MGEEQVGVGVKKKDRSIFYSVLATGTFLGPDTETQEDDFEVSISLFVFELWPLPNTVVQIGFSGAFDLMNSWAPLIYPDILG